MKETRFETPCKMLLKVLLLLHCFVKVENVIYSRTLTEILDYYEILHKQHISHHIVRRSNYENTHTRYVNFSSHGQDFQLKLVTSTSVFASGFDAVVVNGQGVEEPLPVNQDTFYDGYLIHDYNSRASAHIEDGIVTASVHASDDVYMLEPMWMHVESDAELYVDKMIVYKISDLKQNLTFSNSSTKFNLHTPTCSVDSVKKFVVDDDDILHENTLDSSSSSSEELNKLYKKREKRSTNTKKNMCNLVLVSDYLFYKKMQTATYAVNYMLQVVTFVNDIFTNTYWPDVGSGIGFQVKKIIVHSEFSGFNGPRYNRGRNGAWDVNKLLTEFSRTYWGRFCLAHLFTYQDFNKGVIGLAYVATPYNFRAGGICTPRLNCGLSSGENWGRQLLTREAQLVTAHELGHNFGANHDLGSCASSSGGEYLMHATSVAGDKPNNDRFSICSKGEIAAVLKTKQKCFKVPEGRFCGNSIVEEGEECDAGLLDDDAGLLDDDPCCDRKCKLRVGKQCSDSNSICCKNCSIAPVGMLCRKAFPLECKGIIKCDGRSAKCPSTVPILKQGEKCGHSRGNCINGYNCTSLCKQHDMEACLCSAGNDACKVCCKHKGACKPLKISDNIENDGVLCYLSNGNQGYCEKGVCVEPKSNVKDEFGGLLSDFSFSKFARFMEANIVGTILVFSLFLWVPAACIVNYLDKKQDEEHEEMKHWLNPFNRDLLRKGASSKLLRLFHRGNFPEQKLPRTQYHIST